MISQHKTEINLDEKQIFTLTESQKFAYNKMLNIILYFFTRTNKLPINPFRGFLLEGPPASGKTEVAYQVAKSLQKKLNRASPPRDLIFSFIDNSIIAAPQWGQGENNLVNIFKFNPEESKRTILLIDDIDCLMISRGSDIAKEWHYSINSVIFHKLDDFDVTKSILIATTNRPDLIDEALRSRLYSIKILSPKKEEIYDMVKQITRTLNIVDDEQLSKNVINRLESVENPTIRQVQQFIIEECIDSGLWRVNI
jgi:SpoVK/Ycf46/Vps4 family AAA+-type ATPase